MATPNLTVPLEFNNGVFESTGLEGYDRSLADKEFVLDNAARLEKTRHQAKVSATIDDSTICKEFFGCGPETVWIALFKAPHAIGTLSRIGIVHVAGTTYEELDLVIIKRNDLLCNIKDEVYSLLLRDATDEGKERY